MASGVHKGQNCRHVTVAFALGSNRVPRQHLHPPKLLFSLLPSFALGLEDLGQPNLSYIVIHSAVLYLLECAWLSHNTRCELEHWPRL